MKALRIRALHGPSRWARCPMLEVEVDGVGGIDAGPWMHALPELESSGDGARALARLVLALQYHAGSPVQTVEVDHACIAVEFEEESLARACVDAALRLCRGEGPGIDAEMAALRELGHDVRLGPSTLAIVNAARKRGIPARRLNEGSLVQLGHGAAQRRIWTAETDRTSAIAEAVAQDKDLTRQLLQGVGVPVPQGRPVSDADDAWAAAERIGPPVVVKPRFGNHGRGVATNLTTREQVTQAYAAAREQGDEVMVERFVPGDDYRLLVVGDRLIAAALRQPPFVVGDGRSTIAELVATVNSDPRRSDGHATVLSWIKFDAVALAVLAEQGHSPDTIPADGEPVIIRRNANLSSGGTATDVTDTVHPAVAARAVAAAQAIGLDVSGVDVVASRIDVPLEESGGAVVEVNAGPGLRMHLEPSAGSPRAVGEAILDLLFPAGTSGRIPIVAVVGSCAATVASRFRNAGKVVGLACDGSAWIDERQIPGGDARCLLLHPRVEVLVVEVTAAAIERGLGFDRCDVVIRGDGAQAAVCRFVEAMWYASDEEDVAALRTLTLDLAAP